MPRSQRLTQHFFDSIAADYEQRIVAPAFRHFAAAVIHTAQPQGHENALDIGTGTGILARLLAPLVRQVVGIDLAPGMISAGQQLAEREKLPNVTLQTANAHQLPFEDSQFELVVASFGLNATTPSKVLPEIQRVLVPGGKLAFHEWHIQHFLDSLLMDVLAEYMLDEDEAEDDLLAIREYITSPRPWDNVFQTAEDYAEVLTQYGFQKVQIWEDAPAECLLSIPAFLTYKLAWKNRRAELAAMDASRRADCLDALSDALQDHADDDGLLHYNPTLFRVLAFTSL